MRLRYPILIALAIVVVAGLWFASEQAPSVAAPADVTPDDEIAYVNSASRVQIVDPFTASGSAPFEWVSASSGWTNIAPLDANGDGVDELVAIGGNRVEILTPYTPSGTVPPQFSRTISSGFFYNWVTAGDFIPGDGGLPEILVQRTDNVNGSYSVQIYDGNSEGTVWSEVFNQPYGSAWLSIKPGDVDGLEGDEVVMVRNGVNNSDRRMLIFKYAPNGTWPTIFEDVFGYPWLALDLGNSHTNNGGIDEIHVTRSGVLGVLPSKLTFQYFNNNISDAPNGEGYYFPYFHDIASGDVNLSGDEEVFMVRDPGQDAGISLLGLNWGTDSIPAGWTDPGVALGRNLQRVVMGDTDGDGKDEVVVTTTTDYRIYIEPGSNMNNNGVNPASFRLPVAITLGNFDGQGVSSEPGKMQVSSTFIKFEMTRGEANPPSQTFDVVNIGGSGSFAYDVALKNNSGWLSVTPFDGQTPGTHTVSINGSNLAAGTYEDTIVVTAIDPEVLQSPQEILVRLQVKATGPILQVSPTSLSYQMNFGGVKPDPTTISVKNVGDGGSQFFKVETTTDDGASWIKTSLTGGFTDDDFVVTIEPGNLPSGSYTGNIRVDAGEIENSPFDIPVTLTIVPTGMEVTPTELYMEAFKDQASPVAEVQIEQTAAGSGAIHWYAYAVPSGDWWDVQEAYLSGGLEAASAGDGLTFTAPDGVEHVLNQVSWVNLTPSDGITPRVMQVWLDVAAAPVGVNHVTILVDGGPGTPNRFQGVDVKITVSDHPTWLPLVIDD